MSKHSVKLFFTICIAISFGMSTVTGIASDTYAQFDEEPILTLNAKVTKDRENTFDESTIYFHVNDFALKISNETELCPTNSCTFKFIHEDSNGFIVNGVTDRTLDGVLKISSQGKTKIYTVDADLSILEEENDVDGKVTKEILDGTLRLYQGDDTFGGEEYVVNGTLTWNNDKNADLALDGFF